MFRVFVKFKPFFQPSRCKPVTGALALPEHTGRGGLSRHTAGGTGGEGETSPRFGIFGKDLTGRKRKKIVFFVGDTVV